MFSRYRKPWFCFISFLFFFEVLTSDNLYIECSDLIYETLYVFKPIEP